MKRREDPLSAGICIQNKQRVEAALALIIENAISNSRGYGCGFDI